MRGLFSSRLSRFPGGDVLAACVLAAAALAIALPRYRSGMDLSDEGFLACGAVRVLAGQLPHRDFFSLQPPLCFYTVALMFKLLGTSLVSLRVLGVLAYTLVPLSIYALSRVVAGSVLSLACALPALVLGLPFYHFVPLSVWQAMPVNLAAGWLFLLAARGRPCRLWQGFTAGVLTALALLLRHDQGVYLMLTIGVYTLVARSVGRLSSHAANNEPLPVPGPSRLFSAWLAGLGVVLVPLGFYWLATGALPATVNQLVLFPFRTYVKTSALPFPAPSRVLNWGPDALVLLYYLPPAVELAALLWLTYRFVRRQFGEADLTLLFFTVWSGLFYCQVLTRSDINHLLLTLPPFFVLLGCCARHILGRIRSGSSSEFAVRAVPAGLGALAAAGALLLFSEAKPLLLPEPMPPSETITLPRAGVRAANAENIRKFVELVQQHAPADRSILCLPYQPLFYFLADRRNPTRWNYIWPGDQTPAEHQQLLQQARNDPPAVVVLTLEPSMRGYAQDILDYIHQDYRPLAEFGGLFSVYLPK